MTNVLYYKYIFLLPGKSFSSSFLLSWSNTQAYLNNKKISYYFKFGYSPIIHSVRNNLMTSGYESKKKEITAETTELFDNQITCQKVIFIDSDMIWDVSAIQKLLNSKYPVTTAPYVLTGGNITSVSKDGLFMTSSEVLSNTTPFEVTNSGLGFMAVDFNVLKKLDYPYFASPYIPYPFEYDKTKYNNPISVLGEDSYFCQKIIDAGEKIMCDPTIKVGHEKTVNYVVM